MLSAIERRQCSAQDILQACLRRIAARESLVQAWAHPIQEIAILERWRERAQRYSRLPFQGLPLGIKDTIDVYGLPAERGSAIWRGRVAQEDAACVSLLAGAGAYVIGKTVTTEFAYFTAGKTRNPHDPGHTPGGSSSGSAAAVAAGMVPIALGTQTAGSVIRPAAYCGVAAWVATRGAISLRGVMPLAQSCDSLGVFARDVRDLLLIEECLRLSTDSSEPKMPRALLALDPGKLTDSEMGAAYETALADLTAKGLRITRASLSAYTGDWLALQAHLMAYESAQNLAFEYQSARDALGGPLRELIETGMRLSAQAHAQILQRRADAHCAVIGALQGHDALIAPAATGAAPPGLAGTGRPDLSRPWQWLGLPQVCLPCARGSGGLPLGVQLIGLPNQDRELLRHALWLQEHLGWQADPEPTRERT
jgi:Asp-tRNA(Asn)/Glu-tRNA(Gln) amidotransferase A subunit family amidase